MVHQVSLGKRRKGVFFWNHSLNHCTFKLLLRLFKRRLIPRNLSKVRKIPPCVACMLVNSHKRSFINKVNHSVGLIINLLETRSGYMTLIGNFISSQSVLTPQVTGELTHDRFWAVTIFYYYYNYCYYLLLRDTLVG